MRARVGRPGRRLSRDSRARTRSPLFDRRRGAVLRRRVGRTRGAAPASPRRRPRQLRPSRGGRRLRPPHPAALEPTPVRGQPSAGEAAAEALGAAPVVREAVEAAAREAARAAASAASCASPPSAACPATSERRPAVRDDAARSAARYEAARSSPSGTASSARQQGVPSPSVSAAGPCSSRSTRRGGRVRRASAAGSEAGTATAAVASASRCGGRSSRSTSDECSVARTTYDVSGVGREARERPSSRRTAPVRGRSSDLRAPASRSCVRLRAPADRRERDVPAIRAPGRVQRSEAATSSRRSIASCMPASMPDSMCASRCALLACCTRISRVVRPSASMNVAVLTASASGIPS